MKPSTKKQDRQAAVTVELAVTLPVLLILLLGTIDAGQFANTYQTVSNASRECARMAARASTDNSAQVTATAMTYLSDAFPNVSAAALQSAVTVQVSTADGQTLSGSLAGVAPGTAMQVQVSLNFEAVRIISGLSHLNNRTVSTTTYMCRQ